MLTLKLKPKQITHWWGDYISIVAFVGLDEVSLPRKTMFIKRKFRAAKCILAMSLCQQGPPATVGCGKWPSFCPLCWTLRNPSQTGRGAGLKTCQSCSMPSICMMGSAQEGSLFMFSACQCGTAVAKIQFSVLGPTYSYTVHTIHMCGSCSSLEVWW